jgi:hypothetical protein
VTARPRLCPGAAALLALATGAAVRAEPITQTTTQTASLGPMTTNFSYSASNTPLVFQRFDTQNGSRTLDGVTVTVQEQIANNYNMAFTTPATITDFAYDFRNPASTTPTITMYQPDGKTPLLSVTAPADPALVSRPITGSPGQSYSSALPSTSPFYIPPTTLPLSHTYTLTDPTSLALFSGTGALALPISATASSSFDSTSGNGGGGVSTKASAQVTVTYRWHNTAPEGQLVPEPSSLALWGLGGLALALGIRSRARRAVT